MSWDATLFDDRGHTEGDWNYTHNCNRMVHAALADQGVQLPASTRPCHAPPRLANGRLTSYPNGRGTVPWWDHLNGMDGPTGAAYIGTILRGLRADPARFKAMNPENGWGSYETLVEVLEEMHQAVPEWPSRWETSG